MIAADMVREAEAGDRITYIENWNINFTNICSGQCGFCAFKRDAVDGDSYYLETERILEIAAEAIEKGARGAVHTGRSLPGTRHLLL
jgi:FO synthase subunit 2 (EC 2.5.1.-)